MNALDLLLNPCEIPSVGLSPLVGGGDCPRRVFDFFFGGRGNNLSRQRREHCPAASNIPPRTGRFQGVHETVSEVSERRHQPPRERVSPGSRGFLSLRVHWST